MALKEKIVEAAYELFSSKGFEDTTISDVIKMAGSSRGGFYHHFNSKEEILEAITEEYIGEFHEIYNKTIEEHLGSSTELFNKLFSIFYEYKLGQIEEWPKLQKLFNFKGNHVIILKIAKDFQELTTKFYARVITEGIEKGEFTVKYPLPLAGLWSREILDINKKAQKEFYKQDEEKFKVFIDELEFIENMINRELGLEENTIRIKSVVIDYISRTKEQISLGGWR